MDERHDCRNTDAACVPSTVWGTASNVTAKFRSAPCLPPQYRQALDPRSSAAPASPRHCHPRTHRLSDRARSQPQQLLSRQFNVRHLSAESRRHRHKVCQSVEYVVQWGIEHRQLGPIAAIGVDEIQYAKGHKYLTLVYQIEQHCTRLLWIGRERTVASFEQFFALIGEELAGRIEFVCSDMWQPYLTVIRERCSQAIHILDRFHIVAKMNTALDQVRAGEARRLARDGYEPILKKTRWCVLKRRANLTGQQRFRLRDLLRYNLRTARAYLLKEDFQQFWEYQLPSWAGKFLDEWCCQVMRSRIEPMKKIARTLRSHRTLILNYFRARKQYSSGVVEGLNNKAKLTMRKSYGFRTFHVTETALYHALGKLPEPHVAHKFF